MRAAGPALLLMLVLPLASPPPAAPQSSAADLIGALARGGHVLFLRHASRDGRTDSRPVDPLDCAAQSRLSAAGREEARRVGVAFRRLGIPAGPVVSSQYCRCTETAELAFGRVSTDPALNSFYNLDLPKDEVDRRVARLRALVSAPPPPGDNAVVVGHQWHYLGLTGKGIGTAEIAVFQPVEGGYRELGRLTLGELEAAR